jgi:hypothetical protein
MDQHQGELFPFDRSRIYEIHVLGKLTTDIAVVLGSMASTHFIRSDDAESNRTILTAWLPDQAALNGMLNTLYDYGYTLALVRRVEYSAANEST